MFEVGAIAGDLLPKLFKLHMQIFFECPHCWFLLELHILHKDLVGVNLVRNDVLGHLPLDIYN